MACGEESRGVRRRASGSPAWCAGVLPGDASAALSVGRRVKRRPLCWVAEQADGSSGAATPAVGGVTTPDRRQSTRIAVGRGHELDERHTNGLANSSSASDDDFQTAPRTLVGTVQREQGRVLANVGAAVEPAVGLPTTTTIRIRGTAKQLVRAISKMNAKQRKDVTEIRFQGLLDLQVTDTPGRLGHWLVSNFHPADMALHLPNGCKINITKEDVAAVLGFPRGWIRISERDNQVVPPLLGQWREELRQPKGRVTLTALCDELLAHKQGGVWFKRHFSVVVVSTLLYSEHNGYVNQKIVHMFDDVNRIQELDWCGYLLECLVSSHEEWSNLRRLKFTGPIIFLFLLYVDRMVVGTRDVPRSIPVLKGWTSKILKGREAQELKAGGLSSDQQIHHLTLSMCALCSQGIR